MVHWWDKSQQTFDIAKVYDRYALVRFSQAMLVSSPKVNLCLSLHAAMYKYISTYYFCCAHVTILHILFMHDGVIYVYS